MTEYFATSRLFWQCLWSRLHSTLQSAVASKSVDSNELSLTYNTSTLTHSTFPANKCTQLILSNPKQKRWHVYVPTFLNHTRVSIFKRARCLHEVENSHTSGEYTVSSTTFQSPPVHIQHHMAVQVHWGHSDWVKVSSLFMSLWDLGADRTLQPRKGMDAGDTSPAGGQVRQSAVSTSVCSVAGFVAWSSWWGCIRRPTLPLSVAGLALQLPLPGRPHLAARKVTPQMKVKGLLVTGGSLGLVAGPCHPLPKMPHWDLAGLQKFLCLHLFIF